MPMPRITPGDRDFELFFCEGSAFQNGIALLLISFPAHPMPFGPVQAYGPIPPTASRRAPPVHEDTGVYAVRRAPGVPIVQKTYSNCIMKSLY